MNRSEQLFTNTSAGTTADQNFQLDNLDCNAIEVLTRISSLSTGPGSFTVSIQGLFPGTTFPYTLITSSAYTTTGIHALRCATGLTSAADRANLPVPKTVIVNIANGSTEPPNAYRVSANLIG